MLGLVALSLLAAHLEGATLNVDEVREVAIIGCNGGLPNPKAVQHFPVLAVRE